MIITQHSPAMEKIACFAGGRLDSGGCCAVCAGASANSEEKCSCFRCDKGVDNGKGRGGTFSAILRRSSLVEHFGKRTLGEIMTGDLERFLSSLKCAAETRNTYRRDCRTLWSFGEKRGWASVNVAAKTERARAVSKPPGILRPDQAVLFAHYRELVRPKEAERFWSIRPEAGKDKVVAFKQ